jgi:hypothetical protein
VRAHEGQDRSDRAPGIPAGRDLDDVLRRALHAVADPIEPAGDGLTRILHRLATPSMVRQVILLVTDCADLARLITIWLEPAFTWAMRPRPGHRSEYRHGFSHQTTWAPFRPAAPWLRPALAVVSGATIVVIGVVVLGQVHQIVTRTSLNTATSASIPAHAGAHSPGGGHGQSPTTNLLQAAPARTGTTASQAGRTSHRPSCAAAGCPTAGSTPGPATTPSGTSAASPSQSPGPTPTPSKTNHGHHKPHPGKTKGS